MKEKRYFCDYFFEVEEKIPQRPFTFVLIGIIVIVFIFSCEYISQKFENELNSYSENVYVYLDEIADNVINEGVGIDLLALPDDVVKFEITGENDKIIFKYYLDNNKDMSYAVSANMTVELSDSFIVLSKEPNYSSETEYVKDIKFAMIFVSLLNALFAAVCLMLACAFIGLVAALISLANKKKHLAKQQIEKNNN